MAMIWIFGEVKLKISPKPSILQIRPRTMEYFKLYRVRMEDKTVRDHTACKEMEHCHFFESKNLVEYLSFEMSLPSQKFWKEKSQEWKKTKAKFTTKILA